MHCICTKLTSAISKAAYAAFSILATIDETLIIRLVRNCRYREWSIGKGVTFKNQTSTSQVTSYPSLSSYSDHQCYTRTGDNRLMARKVKA